MTGTRAPVIERVLRRINIDADTGCWNWQGGTVTGYGRVRAGRSGEGVLSVHRVTYQHYVGTIPDGLQLDHLCRNRRCCNPDHLEPVTQRENLYRSPIHLAPLNTAKTHCVNGHEFNEANTYRRSKGYRVCRPCHAASELRRYHARRSA